MFYHCKTQMHASTEKYLLILPKIHWASKLLYWADSAASAAINLKQCCQPCKGCLCRLQNACQCYKRRGKAVLKPSRWEPGRADYFTWDFSAAEAGLFAHYRNIGSYWISVRINSYFSVLPPREEVTLLQKFGNIFTHFTRKNAAGFPDQSKLSSILTLAQLTCMQKISCSSSILFFYFFYIAWNLKRL